MDLSDPAEFVPTPLPTRACGECTLCCKVYSVPALEKPAGTWCRHCSPGRGCGIHETNPEQCRAFYCLWMTDGGVPDHWKPSRSKMVATIFPSTGFIYVQVDPGQPRAWTREPYRSELARWSGQLLKSGRHLLVFVNDDATLIIENEAVPLGRMTPGEGFRVGRRMTPQGMRYTVERGA